MSRSMLAIVPLLVASAPAQPARNVEVLGRLNPGTFYSDVWGYHDGAGGEWALLCDLDRLWVVDCTDPRRPRASASVAGAASGWQPSPWRDVKTWRGHAYVVSEGGAGMQIVDLGDPSAPVLVKTWGQAAWSHAHNLALDAETGLAFVFGTDAGMQVLDLSVDPATPVPVTTYSDGGFVHDGHARRGRLWAADLRRNELLVFDTEALPALPLLARVPLPGPHSAHSAWATWDASACVTTNEAPGGPFATFDVTDPRRPRLLATTAIGPAAAVPHGVLARDRLAHLAYYTEGFAVVDIADPASPAVVATLDTFSGASGGFNGVWGVYPFAPSGAIYLSDMGTGLWVVRSPAVSVRSGAATAGAGGVAPRIRAAGSPWLGNAGFAVELSDAAPRQPGLMLLGTTAETRTVAGVTLLVRLDDAVLANAPTDGRGRGRVPLAIPAEASLAGARALAQWIVLDPGSPSGLAASQALTVTPFWR